MSTRSRRQSDEQRAALDRAFQAERRRAVLRWGAAAAILMALGWGAFWAIGTSNKITAQREVSGTLVSWSRPQTYTGSGQLRLSVRLADGRVIVAASDRSLAPQAGTALQVQELIFENGGRSYRWPVNKHR